MINHENPTVIRIDLKGADKETREKLFGSSELKWGQEFEPMLGVIGVNKTEGQHGLMEMQDVIQFTVAFSVSVAGNLLASWLYDIIKDKVTQLRINGKPTRIEKAAIENACKEESSSAPRT